MTGTEILFDSSPFKSMPYEKIEGTNIRVFNEGDTYWFLKRTSCIGGCEPWTQGSETEVVCFLTGKLYFDGFRHLYFGERHLNGKEEEEPHWGYLYCASLNHLSKVIDKLKEIDERVNAKYIKYR